MSAVELGARLTSVARAGVDQYALVSLATRLAAMPQTMTAG